MSPLWDHFGDNMGKVRLSEKEALRLDVLRKIKRGGLSRRKGAELLGLSYRQMKRVFQRFDREGPGGIGHMLRDQKSNHRIDIRRKERILKLYRVKYADFGPTLAVEYLEQDDGERVGIETLRGWLIEAGLWKSRKQGGRHRAWRERKAHRGEMLQMDGSEHDWFEGRRGKASLMVLIDDATNYTYAQFFESETTAAAMTVFLQYVKKHGLPCALYVDRDSIYETTRDSTVDEALRDQAPLTQFGRAMQALKVNLILARSPQAKGRVERRHGVFQDRLVKALRLKGINTLEAANVYLQDPFLDELNARFNVAARSKEDLHRRVPRGVRMEHVLCHQEERVVQNDWTVSWRNRTLQLHQRHQTLGLARKTILVSELLDGTLRLTYRKRELTWQELPARPPRVRKRTSIAKVKERYKPPADHPWRGKKATP